MKIYTRTGDKGETSLVYGERVAKTDSRVDAYGTIDEANAVIGLAISHLDGEEPKINIFRQQLQYSQTVLFHAGAELATPAGKEVKWQLKQAHIDKLEKHIDAWSSELPQLRSFILPGGSQSAAALHQARTVIRRAERIAVACMDKEAESLVTAYLNRLSDYLFTAARYANMLDGTEEIELNPDI